jgi:putative tryptophan/tyrosine transport system substrate-binding protein
MDNALPTFASTEQLMQAGALTGLVSKYYNLGQFTAHKVEQILVAKQDPKTMPVETLKRFSYQISMSAAQRLKLPPPMGMLNFAELINTTNSGS